MLMELCEWYSRWWDARESRDKDATDAKKTPCLPWISGCGGYFDVSLTHTVVRCSAVF
jgi:hypothetical protein